MSKLPILMYHNVSDNENLSKGLTISASKLENQFRYLTDHNYKSFHLSELEKRKEIPERSIVITFDDVTENQLLYAVPLLLKYNLKATFFIPFSYIGKTDQWNALGADAEKIMTLEQLKNLDNSIELGYHSYKHYKYSDLTINQVDEDFSECFKIANENNLKVFNGVAYPYGNYPKHGIKNDKFISALKQNGIKMGLRIGNKVNSFPFKNPYKIKRIDIKGEDCLFKFKLKLRFGKFKLF